MEKKEKEVRGIEFLMNPTLTAESKKKPAEIVNSELRYVRKTIYMTPEDAEFYQDFVYYMKGSSGNHSFSHKDAQSLIMKMLREKYPDVEPRPQIAREIEEKYK